MKLQMNNIKFVVLQTIVKVLSDSGEHQVALSLPVHVKMSL